MSYENPPLPEHVNVSRESVLAEFLRLGAGLVICVLVLGAVLYVGGGWFARFIPFSTERNWVGDTVIGIDLVGGATDNPAITSYLQTLADKLVPAMQLPEGMQIRVHHSDIDTPNAFATLGGHVVVTQGLYRRMPSENALALVLAHEIGHIKARDPISGLGGGATLALGLVLLGGDANDLATQIADVVQRGYSRHAEARADSEAVTAVTAVYGHAGGGAAVFEVLSDYQRENGMTMPSLLSTHPADTDRIARLTAAASTWDAQKQPLIPLAVEPPAAAEEAGE